MVDFDGDRNGQGEEEGGVADWKLWEVGKEGDRGERAGEGKEEEHFGKDGGRRREEGGIRY